jgi:hypothetical protein
VVLRWHPALAATRPDGPGSHDLANMSECPPFGGRPVGRRREGICVVGIPDSYLGRTPVAVYATP